MSSGYDRMKLICMFDLPTDTNEEKKAYRNFRRGLLENGFFMIQYSIYVRTCPNRVFAKKYSTKLKTIAPNNGNIRLITVTEKQYNDMELIVGSKLDVEEILGEKRIIVI